MQLTYYAKITRALNRAISSYNIVIVLLFYI